MGAAIESAADALNPWITPEMLQKVAHLEYRSPRTVLGGLSGTHLSPHRGGSTVFVEHREYRPGDDLRRLDWRAYARSDRHAVKHFEQETQAVVTLVLDASGSMAYADKYRFAAAVLGLTAYVFLEQGDSVALVRHDGEGRVARAVDHRTGRAQFEQIMQLAREPALMSVAASLEPLLRWAAERARKSGVIAVASDLFTETGETLSLLRTFAARGVDVALLHVLHSDEIGFPFDGTVRFLGLEGEPEQQVDADGLAAAYRAEIREFREDVRSTCEKTGIRYVNATTNLAPDQVTADVLTANRKRLGA